MKLSRSRIPTIQSRSRLNTSLYIHMYIHYMPVYLCLCSSICGQFDEEDEANLFSALQLHISTRRSGHIRRPEYLRHPLSLNILGSPRETLLKLYTHVFSGVADFDQAGALQRIGCRIRPVFPFLPATATKDKGPACTLSPTEPDPGCSPSPTEPTGCKYFIFCIYCL